MCNLNNALFLFFLFFLLWYLDNLIFEKKKDKEREEGMIIYTYIYINVYIDKEPLN